MTDGSHEALETELRRLRGTTRALRRWALLLGCVFVLGTVGLVIAHTQARFVG